MVDQFNMENIRILIDLGYRVDVVADFVDGGTISPQRVDDLKDRLGRLGVDIIHIPVPRKISSINEILKSYKMVKLLCNEKQYEIVHCQSPIGGVIARLAAINIRRKGTTVIYTAHGFHFYKSAPLINWIVFYPIEKFCSAFTDILITINSEDYKKAKRSFYCKNVVYIPGVGVDVDKFENCRIDRDAKRASLGIPRNSFVLCSVGELQKRKNHKVVIEALHRLDNSNIYYLIVGRGMLHDDYQRMIEGYGLTDNIRLLGYRNDIAELLQVTDCFVHPSIREGLGIAPLEAMASGIPLISSYVNGMKDYTQNGISGCCLPNPLSVDDMANAISKMYNDEDFRRECGKNNVNTAKNFSIEITNKIMREVYDSR
jgi:glycosyltransferase involved in cell wall biosynthesis